MDRRGGDEVVKRFKRFLKLDVVEGDDIFSDSSAEAVAGTARQVGRRRGSKGMARRTWRVVEIGGVRLVDGREWSRYRHGESSLPAW